MLQTFGDQLVRQGLNKPNIIYVGKFVPSHAGASPELKNFELQNSKGLKSGNSKILNSRTQNLRTPELKNFEPNNTYSNNTELNDIEKKNTHTDLPKSNKTLRHIPQSREEKPVCETASVSVEQLQKDIQAVIGETIVLKRLEKLVHSSSVERIRYHLEHWHVHRQNQTQPGAGYFLTVVENDIPPVEPEKKPHWIEHQVSRRDNFDQREYTDEELERFYVNLAEEESTPLVSVVPPLELPVCELLPNPFIDTPEARNEEESDL